MLISHLSNVGFRQSWFKSYAESAIKYLLSKNIRISSNNSNGGYLSIFEPSFKASPLKLEYIIACGSFTQEEQHLYWSIEKAFRLNEKILIGHIMSRQSIDEIQNEFAGAVYFEKEGKIFSFSGFYPEWDEFISILISCFYFYLENQGTSSLEDVIGIFKKRIDLILTYSDRKELMQEIVSKVVFDEIKLRDKN